jgi:hypothetical protein
MSEEQKEANPIDVHNPPEEDLFGMEPSDYQRMLKTLLEYAALTTAGKKLFGNDMKAEERVAVFQMWKMGR